MPLTFWVAQPLAAYNLLGAELCTVTCYSPHTAAKDIQTAYHKFSCRYVTGSTIMIAYRVWWVWRYNAAALVPCKLNTG
jgi:hypothetical protein